MDEQYTIIFNKREVQIARRALERMKTALEDHIPAESEALAFEDQETIALIRTALFKLSAVENRSE